VKPREIPPFLLNTTTPLRLCRPQHSRISVFIIYKSLRKKNLRNFQTPTSASNTVTKAVGNVLRTGRLHFGSRAANNRPAYSPNGRSNNRPYRAENVGTWSGIVLRAAEPISPAASDRTRPSNHHDCQQKTTVETEAHSNRLSSAKDHQHFPCTARTPLQLLGHWKENASSAHHSLYPDSVSGHHETALGRPTGAGRLVG
jgi:hypothetical protein